ncbi:MAG: 4Fe-4S ferredoxin [Candidatus Eisenbacteria bacterium]|nr:4Fe-4S ferredoxin [Candidatus Eisenbacteria bacterium]
MSKEASREQQKKQKRAWRYPSQSEHPGSEIYIHEDWCKNCGICYEMCPKGVLSCDPSGRPVVENPDACIACYLCEMLCPDMAITVHKERAGKSGTSDDT